MYGPFVESKRPEAGKGQWTVELPEDDPSAIEVIMHLIHGHPPHKIVAVITVELVFEVTVLTKKYGMTSCLWPVTNTWLEELPKSLPCTCTASWFGVALQCYSDDELTSVN